MQVEIRLFSKNAADLERLIELLGYYFPDMIRSPVKANDYGGFRAYVTLVVTGDVEVERVKQSHA
jgi:hypothetical protein